jgi:hypothetical protein
MKARLDGGFVLPSAARLAWGAAIAALLVLLQVAPTHAAVLTLSGTLSSTPPSLGEGTGTATATLNDISGEVAISGTFGTFRHAVAASLRGPIDPPSDFRGPEVLPLSLTLSSPLGNEGTFSGGGTLDASQLGLLEAGRYLVVVETQSSPAGPTASISGNLTLPEPTLGGLLIAVAAAAAFMRHRAATRGVHKKI